MYIISRYRNHTNPTTYVVVDFKTNRWDFTENADKATLFFTQDECVSKMIRMGFKFTKFYKIEKI